jgi:ABC-2 type transport system permease protein
MPTSLLTLLRLHFLGKLRHSFRGLRTPRGLFFLVFGSLALCGWLGPRLYHALHAPREDPAFVRTIAPFAILGFCLSNLFASIGENAVAFTGAEIDFLFPGPFTRRSLLGYKILKTALGTTITSIIFSILLLRYSTSWIACCLGIWLTVQFMQLFAITIIMLAQTIGERAYSGTRRGIFIVAGALVGIAAIPTLISHLHSPPLEIMKQVHGTIAGRLLLAPFDVFARTITARPGELLQWATLAFLIDLIMLAVVIGLDANYLETASAVSQKRYERRQRAHKGVIGQLATVSGPRFRVYKLPRLGGAGPIAWRQMIGAARSSRAMFLLLLVIGFGAGSMVWQHRKGGSGLASLEQMLGTVVWMNLVFISMLKFDFRDELDRLDLLRSLPIGPTAIAAAELFTPVLVLTLMQGALLIALAVSVHGAWRYVLPAAAFAVPFNLLQAGIENLLFLMFPLRSAGVIAGDMQLVGRQMIVFVFKFGLLMLAAVACSAAGAVGYVFGGGSWRAFSVMAWVVLVFISLITIPLLGRAFTRFDPSVHTPP